MTDGDTDTLAKMRENVERNGGDVECRQLRWGKLVGEWDKFQVVMGSDVMYHDEGMMEALVDTAVALLEDGGMFVLGFYRRSVKIDSILEYARKSGLKWEGVWGGGDPYSDGVFLWRLG